MIIFTPSRRTLLQQSLLVPLLAACGLGSQPVPRRFGLKPLSSGPQKQTGAVQSIAISVPRALKSLDSERIVNRRLTYELQAYAGADWVDRAPVMLQLLMIRSFQNMTPWQVSASDLPGPLPEFLLTSILEDFQTEQGDFAGIRAQIAMVATLERTNHRQTLQTRPFSAASMATSDHIDDIVAAFDNALAAIMRDMIAWAGATMPQMQQI